MDTKASIYSAGRRFVKTYRLSFVPYFHPATFIKAFVLFPLHFLYLFCLLCYAYILFSAFAFAFTYRPRVRTERLDQSL
jgi:hypothetical protein